MGTILIDPNGYHKGVPWNALRAFCATHPRFDLIINLNIRCFRMERPHILRLDPGWEDYEVIPVSQFPVWFNRKVWMWTEVTTIKGNSWMQFVGRSFDPKTPGYSSLGFYDSRSDRGRRILAELETQKAEPEFPLLQDV